MIASWFQKQLSPGVFTIGNDQFFAILKDAKAKRRAKDYEGAIEGFHEAITIAQRAGAATQDLEVEIARTWWHQGKSDDAVRFCSKRLPDPHAAELLVAIWREEANGAVKQGLNELALTQFEMMGELCRRTEATRMTPKDRDSMRKLRKTLRNVAPPKSS